MARTDKKSSQQSNGSEPPARSRPSSPEATDLAAALAKIGDVLTQGVAALQQVAQQLAPPAPATPAVPAAGGRRKRGAVRAAPEAELPADGAPRTAAGPMRRVGREWQPADIDPDDPVGLATVYPEANIKPQRRLEKARLAQANGRAVQVNVGEHGGRVSAFGDNATAAAKTRLRSELG